MSRRRDAALAAGLLALAGVLFWSLDAGLRPAAFVAGGVGTVGSELLAYRFESRVRDLWARRSVRIAATVIAGVAVLTGAWIAPAVALSAAVGALGTYLSLLGLVAAASRR